MNSKRNIVSEAAKNLGYHGASPVEILVAKEVAEEAAEQAAEEAAQQSSKEAITQAEDVADEATENLGYQGSTPLEIVLVREEIQEMLRLLEPAPALARVAKFLSE